ncbi:Regulator of ribosome biosynthesis [Pseudocercospora fuligena]|uniref:Ribosome biogenesis regulatory protein n=1 Tax=Pseudocercospora fuligena TaxID=685502 RepID=A0A8H6RBV8_9PEZI|nr:Regulator of ribosome biosynthesis [Pseudocercospora fuligena]
MSAMDIDTQRAQPYTFDLGHLACYDPNPLPSLSTDPAKKESILQSTAQTCAQSLIHQLLTTCPISRNEDDGTLQIKLPEPEFRLPREKPVPKEKEKTKWERFAEKKGIKKKGKDGKQVFDEERGEWKQKYGYKPGEKRHGEVQGDWIVEVDEKAERQAKEGAKSGGKPGKVKGEGDIARRDRKLNKRKGK